MNVAQVLALSSEVSVGSSESECLTDQVTLGSEGEVLGGGEVQFDGPDSEEIKDRTEAGSLSTDILYQFPKHGSQRVCYCLSSLF